MNRVRLLLVFFISAISLGVAGAYACDPCALYSASRLEGHDAGSLTLSISEQYTTFDKAQDIAPNSVKDGEFVRGFSTTQFALAYDVSDSFGAQVTVPLVLRRFDEVQDFRSSSDSDAGLGDITLAGSYSFIDYKEGEYCVLAGVTLGVKLPTGDTGVLGDIVDEEERSSSVDERIATRHHQIGGASGGRALAFGSGSFDYIAGVNLLARYERYLIVSDLQYTIRTEGDFDYEYADDFLWTVGPGYYLYLEHERSLAILASLSGEFKSKDHLEGELVEGSAISNLYLGPELLFAFDENLGGEIGLDFRVTGEDPDATVVPEARLRAGISYMFS